MSKQKKKTMKNTPKTMRGEKVKDASKLSSQSPQIGNKMKQKYIQRLKDSPKSKEERAGQTTEQTDTQAIEQVQNSGQWAAAELAGTTGRMVRQGREYAKKKAKAAKQDTPVSPADDPPEQPACTPPEVMPPKELDPAPLTHQFPPQKAPSPMENSIPGQAPPATAPKELRPKKRPIPANAPKERQPELLGDRPTLSSLAGSLDITGADEREVLAALPADLEQARRDTVEKALSLVGKVNYFWGGKSHAIGWDDRWGTLRKVTAAGSPSTGTYRPFGLDCSGMIDWALRNAGLPSDGNWYIGTNLTRVSASEARPGDMALFPDASHIGIVVGRNDAGKLLVCHCSSGRNNVVVTEFSATGFTVVGRPNMFD